MFNSDTHEDTTERDAQAKQFASNPHDDTTERENPMNLVAQNGHPTYAQPPLDTYYTAVPTYAQTQWREAPAAAPAQPYTPHTTYNSQTDPHVPVQPLQPQPVQRRSRGLRTGAIMLLTALLAVVFGTGLFAGWQFGRGGTTPVLTTTTTQSTSVPATTSGSSTEAIREAVIARVRPAIVLVTVTTANGTALGSGEIVNKQGYIVTNNHVVNGATSIQVTLSDGTRTTAQLTGTDAADDLAVIKITPPTANLAVITIGDSSQIKVGQEVLAIGNPLGNTQTVTNGIISALNRSVSEGQGSATIPDAIQTDAPINPGNSGGALVDMQGNLIGIPTLTAIDPQFNTPANGVGFAIPANRVKLIVPQIIQTGQVTHTGRAVLGVSVTSVDAALASQYNLGIDHGVLITALTSGGAAERAGLKSGDVIVKVDNTTINDTSSLGNALITKNPGDSVKVTYYRNGQQQTINATLGELKAS
ncbi:MAG: hypothetical protein NVS4B1_37220 [Ktedonobacteraceae bacterium]